MVRCPICDLLSPETSPACVCGYELSTGDAGTAIARLEHRRREVRRLTARGVLTAAAGPPVLISFLWLPPVVGVMMPIVGMLMLAVGTWWTIRGAGEGREIRRRLRTAHALGELPQARLLTR